MPTSHDLAVEYVAKQDPALLSWLGDNLINGTNIESSCISPGVVLSAVAATSHNSSTLEHSLDQSEIVQKAVYWALGVVAFMLLTSFIFHIVWLRRTAQKEDEFQRRSHLDRLVNSLVVHFAPLVAVEGYQFKGMRGSALGVRLDFEELGLNLKADGRSVLQGVTGSFDRGKMAAIMGPSGSGKTTFMNTLCGKATYGDVSGKVKVNGRVGVFDDLKPIMGFVPQDDVVHESLTVREQIEFSAKLRNDRTTSRKEIAAIVEDVLHVLQIGHIQRSIVGGVERRGISGGQRKRVNIGLELAACPVLLFLDEPTSGLDSTSSLMIVNALKKMTELGMSIIMVIHQPRYSLYSLFDQVLLLGAGGRTVYLGSPEGAVNYFDKLGFQRSPMENPADWLMDVVSGEVASPHFPEFRREMLFVLWERNGAEGEAADANSAHSRRQQRRSTLSRNSYEVFKGMISHNWDEADPHGTGTLTKWEMTRFLGACLEQQVDLELVEELMSTIGGSSSSRQQSLVHKGDFEDFMKVKFEALMRQALPRDLPTDPRPWDSEESTSASAKLEQRDRSGLFVQWVIVCHRRLVQFWREWLRRLLDLFLICLCAVCFALMQRGKAGNPVEISTCHMGLSLMIGVAVLPTFADRPILWRETSSGVNVVALYFARICVSMIDATTLIVTYSFVYWLVMGGDSVEFRVYLVPLLCLGWVISAWGYLFSVIIPPRNAILVTLVVVLVMTQVLGSFATVTDNVTSGGLSKWSIGISPTRWSVPMQFMMFVDSQGGPIYGLQWPSSPNCTGITSSRESECTDIEDSAVFAENCSQDDDNVSLFACVQALQNDCIQRATREANKEKTAVLTKWMTERTQIEWTRWAYAVLAANHTWQAAGLVLIIQGLVLHVIAFVCLLQQSPGAKRVKESIGFCTRSRIQDMCTKGGEDSEGASSASEDEDA